MNKYSEMVTIFLLIVFSPNIYSQWVQTNGPFGGNVQCLARNGINIFAGTDYAGVFISSDYGASWLPTSLNNGSIRTIAVADNHIYAGTFNGVFLSTDNGIKWSPFNDGLVGMTPPIQMLNTDGSQIVAATDYGVYRTTSYSSTWYSMGLISLSRAIASKNNVIFVGTLFQAYRSTNYGQSWISMSNGLGANVSAFLFLDTTNIFAATGGGGVFRSTNNGLDWFAVNNGLINKNVSSLAVTGEIIFAGTNMGVYFSTNNGSSWSSVSAPISNVQTLLVNGRDIFTGTPTGIYFSTYDGSSWADKNNGLTSTVVQTMAVSNDNIFVSCDRLGVFRSTNSGQTWMSVNTGLPNSDVLSFCFSGNNIFAGTFLNGIYFSSNNGLSWAPAGILGSIVTSLAANGNTIFAASNYGVFRSTNNGIIWVPLTHVFPNTNVSALAISGNNIFAGTSNGEIFRSSDNGASWSIVYNVPGNREVKSILINHPNIFAGTYMNGIYLSTDFGTSWSQIDIGVTYIDVNSLCNYGNNIFAATSFAGILLSTNNGFSWIRVNTGLNTLGISSVAICNSNLFAGTRGQGVWKRPLTNMITEIEQDLSLSLPIFHLNQNYPNPFNSSTRISWQSPVGSLPDGKAGHQTLKVYDVLGNEVATLVDEYKPAGRYEVEFSASSGIRYLASGIYFYQLKAGDFVQTKKMILIR